MKTSWKLLPVVLLIAATAFALGAGGSTEGYIFDGDKFRADLEGENEVPPVMTDTSGRAEIRFNKHFTAADFRLRVNDGVQVTQAHIHCGDEGENGPVIMFLAGFHSNGWDVDGDWIRATLTSENIINDICGSTLEDVAEAIADGRTYVNVHTVANPPGEVRGQLR